MSAFGFAKWVFSKREAMNNITCIGSVWDHDSASVTNCILTRASIPALARATLSSAPTHN